MITLVRFLLGFMLVLTSLFLILLVLIQRGRGGGLSGAFGGAGGQSAFGTKAGDVFTKITVGVAAFWIGLCILAINLLGRQESLFSPSLGGAAPQAVAPQSTEPVIPAAPAGVAPDESSLELPAANSDPVAGDGDPAAGDGDPAAGSASSTDGTPSDETVPAADE
jgi:preprotein translocase subunit SecG